MGWFNRILGREARALSVEDVFRDQAGGIVWGGTSAAGISVTIESALQVPAVAAAVNVIASTLASLPLDVYRRRPDGSREDVKGGLATLLHDAPNDYLTSFEWRKGLIVGKLTGGRGLSYIERGPSGSVQSIWPMDPACTTVRRDGFALSYEYRGPGMNPQRYRADEVIDLPFMLKADGLGHRGPITLGREAIGLAIALTQYGSKFFAGGGVPPFVVTGNFQTPGATKAAADDFYRATQKAASEQRLALAVPTGIEIKQLGTDPEKSQMIETQRFCIEQIARLYSIPPTFLQDLTHGTFSNTEQQDLHFVKHTLLHHAKQFEQELNLKLFGRKNNRTYVELNMDGLLRGDFKTRMEGWARAVQAAIVTPDEVRTSENWPAMGGAAAGLFIQGATVPIELSGKTNPGTPPDSNAQGAK